jgi:hypothetical protein
MTTEIRKRRNDTEEFKREADKQGLTATSAVRFAVNRAAAMRLTASQCGQTICCLSLTRISDQIIHKTL